LLWLAMRFPAVYDAVLDKVEYDPIDDDPDPRRNQSRFARFAALTSAYSSASAWTGGTFAATAPPSARSSYSTRDMSP